MSKKIQLSDHFTYGRLLRFVMPSILMILCTSVYTIVDGFFVSNYVGKTAFAALNLVCHPYPLLNNPRLFLKHLEWSSHIQELRLKLRPHQKHR